MLVADFLNFLLEDCLEEARLKSLGTPDGQAGFLAVQDAVERCRTCMTGEDMARDLGRLLQEARASSAHAVSTGSHDQWFWFVREAQVEWIAEMVSIVLLERRLPTIVPPGRGAAMAAAALIGVRLD